MMKMTAREVADLTLLHARGNQDLALMDLAALLIGFEGLLAQTRAEVEELEARNVNQANTIRAYQREKED